MKPTSSTPPAISRIGKRVRSPAGFCAVGVVLSRLSALSGCGVTSFALSNCDVDGLSAGDSVSSKGGLPAASSSVASGGAEDGTSVGGSVSSSVGLAVGCSVGISVGSSVGTAVGASVGRDVAAVWRTAGEGVTVEEAAWLLPVSV